MQIFRAVQECNKNDRIFKAFRNAPWIIAIDWLQMNIFLVISSHKRLFGGCALKLDQDGLSGKNNDFPVQFSSKARSHSRQWAIIVAASASLSCERKAAFSLKRPLSCDSWSPRACKLDSGAETNRLSARAPWKRKISLWRFFLICFHLERASGGGCRRQN